jgi:hypothetical protein
MNVVGKLHYVSPKNLKEAEKYYDNTNKKMLKQNYDIKTARREIFRPGNKFAVILGCGFLSCIIIGNFIFVHGGIVPEFLENYEINGKEDFVKINYIVRKWLLGLTKNNDFIDRLVHGTHYSIFWDRTLGTIKPNINYNKNDKFEYNNHNEQINLCQNYLDETLKLLNAKGMVIGHSPQFFNNNAGINATCNDKLWRIDHGGSELAFGSYNKNYDNKKPQILEILNDQIVNIIYSE